MKAKVKVIVCGLILEKKEKGREAQSERKEVIEKEKESKT